MTLYSRWVVRCPLEYSKTFEFNTANLVIFTAVQNTLHILCSRYIMNRLTSQCISYDLHDNEANVNVCILLCR